MLKMQRTEALTPCWWDWKMVQPLWEIICQFLSRLNMYLPYNPANTLYVCLRNKNLFFHKNPYVNGPSDFFHKCLELEIA